jgi:methionyl aminopeptidase
MAIQLKDLDQLKVMRRAGIVVAEIHQLIRDAIKPGMTTSALDAIPELPRLSCNNLRFNQ